MMKHSTLGRTEFCALQRSKQGNNCCGDSYYIYETESFLICAIADGLGSGDQALKSSSSAIRVVQTHCGEDVKFIMETCNKELRFERGVVMAVFKIYFDEQIVEYSGVGNVNFALYSPYSKTINPIPTSGFLSGRPQPIQVQQFPFEEGSCFIIYSDGLKVRSLKNVVDDSQSPMYTFRQLEKYVKTPDDDVTILVGKVN